MLQVKGGAFAPGLIAYLDGFRPVALTQAHSAGRPRWLMRLDLSGTRDAATAHALPG